MAYLYAYSATWRAIVNATRNPKIMAVFATATTAGFVLVWRGSEALTKEAMMTTEEELREKIAHDNLMKQYATTSERALAAMFAQAGKGQEENADLLRHNIKVPGVEWHPKAEQRERKPQSREQRSAGTENVATTKPATSPS